MKLLLVLIGLVSMCSCDSEPIVRSSEGTGPFSEVTHFNYKGHDYIGFFTLNHSGIVHNPECKKCYDVYD